MARGGFASLLTEKFFTSCSICLTLPRGACSASRARCVGIAFDVEDATSGKQEIHILSVFSASRKNLCAVVCDDAPHRAAVELQHPRRRNIWCRRARNCASPTENTGFFVAL
jgi:hypothetical protein